MNNLEKFKLITWRPFITGSREYELFKEEFYVPTTLIFSDDTFLSNNTIYKRVDISNIILKNPISKLQNSIEYLKLNDTYNFNIDLPEKLFVLIFGKLFNKKINYSNKIFYIKYGNKFNQPVDNLPESLEFLIFPTDYNCESFNQPIENLPIGLKLLNLSNMFNNSVDFLPNNLLYLNLGKNFNQPIDNLPSSLIELTFGDGRLYSTCDKEMKDILCDYVNLIIKEILNLSEKKDKIIKKNKYKEIYFKLNLSGCFKFNYTFNNLPNNLKYLLLPNNYDEKIEKLPKNIEYIKFSYNYSKDITFLSNYDKLKLLTIDNIIKHYVKELNKKTKSKKLTIKINQYLNDKSTKTYNLLKYLRF